MQNLTLARLLPAFAVTIALAGPAAAQEGGPPAMPVSVSQPLKREVVNWSEFPGRFQAAAEVAIRAQVSGALESVKFEDGQNVQAGDLLFVIDQRPFAAALRAAEAALTGNRTRLDLSQSELNRASDLRKSGNIPEATFQQRQQTFLEAQANLAASEAEVETARLNLGYSEIQAPISGRIGRKLVDAGNIIASGSAGTLLTTIVQHDPIHFYFDVDEQNFLNFQRQQGGNARNGGASTVFIKTADSANFDIEGRIDFLDNRLDEATGTIRVRAVVENDQGRITPGQFGRIQMPLGKPYEALLIPAVAVQADQIRQIVIVVGEDDTVQPRPVTLGGLFGDLRAVTDGLKGDERIIVNGLMRAQPGAKVVPQPVEIEAPADLTRPPPAQQQR